MARTSLTRTERRLRREVEDIAAAVDMDVWNLERYEPELRAQSLRIMKDQLVRGSVIIKYTLIDEYLTDIICNYYFHGPDKELSYQELWKTKRFRIFVHYLMDEIFLLKKLAVVEAIMTIPKEVSKAVKRINDVRNDLAHSFFPQNRRRYKEKRKVMYNGVHLFTRQGVEAFEQDYDAAEKFLWKKAFGDTPRSE